MELLKKQSDVVINEFICSEKKYNDIYAYIFEGGKRLRQMIVFAIAESLNKHHNTNISVSSLSLGIEMIHNASLIIDDLPCMDNDDYRRGKLTVHKKYGVPLALQLSIMILRKSFQKIYDTLKQLDSNAEKIYIYNVIMNNNLGKDGLPMGQFMDINFLKNKIGLTTKKDYQNLIYKKTTTLFNLSFLLTYVLYENDKQKIDIISKASKYFGIAFQLYDDFTDINQDLQSKTPNYIIKYGCENTYKVFNDSCTNCIKNLEIVGISHVFFTELFQYLDTIVKKEIHAHRSQFP
jgi:geranylgeranyl diphosphate synthase type II